MIVYGTGDLLTADVDALVNTVNCVGVMGKGIALQFKRRYPKVFAAYEQACKRGEVKIGEMFVVATEQISGPQLVINFPTKRHWRSPSKLDFISEGLLDLRRVISEYQISSIAIPPLGAGNGGLEWSEVEPLILRELSDLQDVEIRLYAPSVGRRPIAAKRDVRLTWGRAVLLELIRAYVTRRSTVEPWEDEFGASHLEIQKLMYFANEFESRLRLDFTPGRYGPYSEKVRHLIQEMEGSFLRGHGDGTAPVLSLDPIAPTAEAFEELAKYETSERGGEVTALVSRILYEIEGFEGHYGLELLASTHWVMCRERVVDDVPERVRGWTHRKGRIFTDSHVQSAIRHLQGVGEA